MEKEESNIPKTIPKANNLKKFSTLKLDYKTKSSSQGKFGSVI